MDYWEEEYKIYKTFGCSGKAQTNGYEPDYNVRNRKKARCGCGGHTQRDCKTFNKGIRVWMKSPWCLFDKRWLEQCVFRRKKNWRLMRRRIAMKQTRPH